MKYVIAIANEKGGVAKTTSTISLGAALAESGKRVLAVDLDAQANLSLSLGFEPSKNQYSMANVFTGTAASDKIIQKSGVPGMDLIPSNKEMGMSERILPMKSGYEFHISKMFSELDTTYDFILMDCPPFLGAVTINALTACNLLIIPTQPEYFSIYALRNMMSLIRWLRQQKNPKLAYRLLLTLFDRRNRVHRELSDQLKTNFGEGLFNTVIEIDTRLRECPLAGKSIFQFAPKSRSCAQYRALGEEILSNIP